VEPKKLTLAEDLVDEDDDYIEEVFPSISDSHKISDLILTYEEPSTPIREVHPEDLTEVIQTGQEEQTTPPQKPEYGRSVKFAIVPGKGVPGLDSSTYTSLANDKGSSYCHFSDFQNPGAYDDDSDEEEEALFLQNQRS